MMLFHQPSTALLIQMHQAPRPQKTWTSHRKFLLHGAITPVTLSNSILKRQQYALSHEKDELTETMILVILVCFKNGAL